MLKIYCHGSYIGNTGYNNHTREFFRQLSKHAKIKVRNFTIGNSWTEMSDTPHDGEPYINETDKNILYQQSLWTTKPHRKDVKMYQSEDKEFKHFTRKEKVLWAKHLWLRIKLRIKMRSAMEFL
jgi:hypothetical protein